MAYPTTVNFQASQSPMGGQPINAISTTQAAPLGTTIRAVDPVYGEGVFIYLLGIGSTAAGDLVTYDSKSGTTTRSVLASRGPVAVAMAASVALNYGWYQVYGAGVVSSTAAGTGAANSLLAVTATPGRTTVSGGAAAKVDGVFCTTAQDAPGAGYTGVQLNWPAGNGNT